MTKKKFAWRGFLIIIAAALLLSVDVGVLFGLWYGIAALTMYLALIIGIGEVYKQATIKAYHQIAKEVKLPNDKE